MDAVAYLERRFRGLASAEVKTDETLAQIKLLADILYHLLPRKEYNDLVRSIFQL